MRFEFRDSKIERLYRDLSYTAGYGHPLVKAVRNRMQLIAAAKDERDLHAWKSLRFEKLRGKRAHQRSIRLNDQYRLIVEFVREADGNMIVIVGIEDYH